MAARKVKRSEQLAPASRYQLLVRLAAGGMGAVYLGVDKTDSSRLIAIKRPHVHLADEPSFRKMFVAEAQLAMRVNARHAVGVLEVEETEGELLMVMPYVEGGSLGELLVASHDAGRRLPPMVTLRIVIDAARGLHAAHELKDEGGRILGIVHRDVSPQNILIGLDGVASIVDFGVAKAADIEVTKTATDVLKGKTAYMAPEYVGHRVATPKSDVFSLGVACWESLANKRLFKGEDDLESMRRVLDPTPAPMLSDVMSIDTGVAAIIARALVKDPAKRFATALEFAEALEAKARHAELLATAPEVSATVRSLLAETLGERRALLAEVMRDAGLSAPPSAIGPISAQSGVVHKPPALAPLPPPARPPNAPTMQLAATPAPHPIAAPQPPPPQQQQPFQYAPAGGYPQMSNGASGPSSSDMTIVAPPQFAAQPPTAAAPDPMVTSSSNIPTVGAFALGELRAAQPKKKTPWPLLVGGLAAIVGVAAAVFVVQAARSSAASPRADSSAKSTSSAAQTTATAPAVVAAPVIAPAASTAVTAAQPTASESASPSSSAPFARSAAPNAPQPRATSPVIRPQTTATGWRPKSNPYQ